MKHLKQLANSPCGVLELINVTQKWDRVVQNLCQMMRVSAVQKKCDHTEERSARVKELKVRLQQHHGSNYSAVQYTLWAEMLVGETHDSLDNPSEVPMFELSKHILITHCTINNVRMRS